MIRAQFTQILPTNALNTFPGNLRKTIKNWSYCRSLFSVVLKAELHGIYVVLWPLHLPTAYIPRDVDTRLSHVKGLNPRYLPPNGRNGIRYGALRRIWQRTDFVCEFAVFVYCLHCFVFQGGGDKQRNIGLQVKTPFNGVQGKMKRT